MLEPIRLTRPVASNTKAIPDDVLALKAFLRAQGYYDAPDWGLTAYPDTALFAALEAYQADYGLTVDGVVKPDGETETTIRTQVRAQAKALQSLGRNGDTLLVHITPDEAALLEQRGGAGTRNPQTGLLEFYDADKKKGKYIWHTAGDSKVRSSHAARDGQEFSWNDPPEGGHPGEAPNCRCWAEDVKEEDNCAVLLEEIRKARNAVLEAKITRDRVYKTWKEKNEREKSTQAACENAIENAAKGGMKGAARGWSRGKSKPEKAAGAIVGGISGAIRSAGKDIPECIAANEAFNEALAALEELKYWRKEVKRLEAKLRQLETRAQQGGCMTTR